jgi:hypothetical protein
MDKYSKSITQLDDLVLEKHKKYELIYKKNIIYWGLGIENEVYLETKHKIVNKKDIITNRKRERYSIDYYKNYKEDKVKSALEYYISTIPEETITIPLLLNAHSFTKTDYKNQPRTLYRTTYTENPNFIGETLIETLVKSNTVLKNTIDKTWVFDGDSIEFITLDFFNTTLDNVIKELDDTKISVVQEINSCSLLENPIKIMEENYPFVMYSTNLNQIAMFNNGTLHYNLTLPTELNKEGKIQNWDKFINDHKQAIRMIQWMEPFLIACYCTPDVFSAMPGFLDRDKFSKASQRCAVSRYIGIGTYDTDKMERGKILTKPLSELSINEMPFWWYNIFYENNAYTKLDEIGMDINFNKHFNHGIELRFFDHITDKNKIKESFEFIIYLMDFVLESDQITRVDNPIINPIWNNITYNMLLHGKDYVLNPEEIDVYNKIFNIQITETNIVKVYYEIFKVFINKYHNMGKFSQFTLPADVIYPDKDIKVIIKKPVIKQSCCVIC